MLNALFCAQMPDHRIALAAVRCVLGGLIVIVGWHHDGYFPAILQGRDYNSLQTGIDAGILATYIAALLAIIAADYCDGKLLDSAWLTVTPLIAFPVSYLGYYLRKNRHAANPAVQAHRHDSEPLLP